MMRAFKLQTIAMGIYTSLAVASALAQESSPKGAAPGSDTPTTPTFNTPTAKPALNEPPVPPGAYDLAGIGRRTTDEERILTSPVSGVPIRFDNGVFLFASALAGIGHNDNVTGVSTGKISSSLASLQPKLVAELKKSGDRYTLAYTGNYTKFNASPNDNFDNHSLILAGDNYFDSRSRLGWNVGYIKFSDPRGTISTTFLDTPDRWTAPVAQLFYAYGAKEARGRLEFEAALQSKRYENNRTITAGRDVDMASVAGRFVTRLAPKTDMVVEARQLRMDYKLSTSTYDNVDTKLLVGMNWNAAAKTSGGFRIGYQYKDYTSPGTKDAKGLTYEGHIKWSPLTYSVVDATITNSAIDSTGLGSYLKSTGANVIWTHKWKSFLTSRTTLGFLRSEYVDANRTDELRNIGIGVFYDISKNMRTGLELTTTRRASNVSMFDFNRNTAFLSLEGTL